MNRKTREFLLYLIMLAVACNTFNGLKSLTLILINLLIATYWIVKLFINIEK